MDDPGAPCPSAAPFGATDPLGGFEVGVPDHCSPSLTVTCRRSDVVMMSYQCHHVKKKMVKKEQSRRESRGHRPERTGPGYNGKEPPRGARA